MKLGGSVEQIRKGVGNQAEEVRPNVENRDPMKLSEREYTLEVGALKEG